MYIFCSAPEEEQTVSSVCFAKKAEDSITILKTEINREIIVFQITQICNNIANTIEKTIMGVLAVTFD